MFSHGIMTAAFFAIVGMVYDRAHTRELSALGGFTYFLGFMALISISLGVLNLLPVPILDGGQVLYQLAEMVKGSPLSEELQVAGQKVGIAFLVALMGFAFYNDIVRLIG